MPVASDTQNIKIAVDAVIFTVQDGDLKVLLIQMKKKPFEGLWAVPGGRISDAERTEQAVRRILETETGLSKVYLEQLATFDEIQRDPLERVVSVAYMALIPSADVVLRTSNKYADVRWWSVKEIPSLAYDHKEVIRVAVDRLRGKLAYSNIAWSLLPSDFTLTDLQSVYETILGKALDKRNFRRKILSLGLVVALGKKQTGKKFRPADLYKFKDHKLVYMDVL